MKAKKRIFCPVAAGLMVMMLGASSCGESPAEKGKQAAAEFCNCYDKNSKDECFERLKRDYPEYLNDDFINAFNNSNTCNAVLTKITTSASADFIQIIEIN